jgi:tetratricopeptide (TPR) repeat protein
VLDGTDDPGVLNDAAYMLSEAGADLALAEDASRKSIAKLEEASATITTDQVNSSAFARANLLIASWDTLGWILFKEGKLDQAKPLLDAAWRASLRAEIGDHLGQVYEAMGQKDEALTTYEFARTACNSNTPQDVHAHITESVQRLNAAGAKERTGTGAGAAGPEDLQGYQARGNRRLGDVPAGDYDGGGDRVAADVGRAAHRRHQTGARQDEVSRTAAAGFKGASAAQRGGELLDGPYVRRGAGARWRTADRAAIRTYAGAPAACTCGCPFFLT